MKRDTCFECKKELTQAGYDYQACECGWGPFGDPSAAAIAKAKLAELQAAQDRQHAEHMASQIRQPIGRKTTLAAALARIGAAE